MLPSSDDGLQDDGLWATDFGQRASDDGFGMEPERMPWQTTPEPYNFLPEWQKVMRLTWPCSREN